MTLFVPLVSLIGPIYFAVRGFPLEAVLAWAAAWTGIRFLFVWKQAFAALKESDSVEPPPSWLNRHYPSFALVGVFMATLALFEVTHVVVYWTLCRLIQNSN
ncbi:MAG: hypothetical protein E5V89_00975 [Mesorhizobium sp.]|nr:MAG: hypothetical protein E5V89_00975 [Mesorhizobium sp.]